MQTSKQPTMSAKGCQSDRSVPTGSTPADTPGPQSPQDGVATMMGSDLIALSDSLSMNSMLQALDHLPEHVVRHPQCCDFDYTKLYSPDAIAVDWETILAVQEEEEMGLKKTVAELRFKTEDAESVIRDLQQDILEAHQDWLEWEQDWSYDHWLITTAVRQFRIQVVSGDPTPVEFDDVQLFSHPGLGDDNIEMSLNGEVPVTLAQYKEALVDDEKRMEEHRRSYRKLEVDMRGWKDRLWHLRDRLDDAELKLKSQQAVRDFIVRVMEEVKGGQPNMADSTE